MLNNEVTQISNLSISKSLNLSSLNLSILIPKILQFPFHAFYTFQLSVLFSLSNTHKAAKPTFPHKVPFQELRAAFSPFPDSLRIIFILVEPLNWENKCLLEVRATLIFSTHFSNASNSSTTYNFGKELSTASDPPFPPIPRCQLGFSSDRRAGRSLEIPFKAISDRLGTFKGFRAVFEAYDIGMLGQLSSRLQVNMLVRIAGILYKIG